MKLVFWVLSLVLAWDFTVPLVDEKRKAWR